MKNDRMDTDDVIIHSLNILGMVKKNELYFILFWTVLLLIINLVTNYKYVNVFMPRNSAPVAGGPVASPPIGAAFMPRNSVSYPPMVVASPPIGMSSSSPSVSLVDYDNPTLGLKLKRPFDWE